MFGLDVIIMNFVFRFRVVTFVRFCKKIFGAELISETVRDMIMKCVGWVHVDYTLKLCTIELFLRQWHRFLELA